MSKFLEDLPRVVLYDWMNAALGQKLGGGIGRKVFVYGLNPKFVVKVEQQGFQNVIEWEMWKTVKNTPYARWFAPAVEISGLGTILLMERTLPAPRAKYPSRLPEFLGDCKYSNYGLLRGRIVCHDYGLMSLATNGLSKRTRKADWWDAGDGSSFDDKAKRE